MALLQISSKGALNRLAARRRLGDGSPVDRSVQCFSRSGRPLRHLKHGGVAITPFGQNPWPQHPGHEPDEVLGVILAFGTEGRNCPFGEPIYRSGQR